MQAQPLDPLKSRSPNCSEHYSWLKGEGSVRTTTTVEEFDNLLKW